MKQYLNIHIFHKAKFNSGDQTLTRKQQAQRSKEAPLFRWDADISAQQNEHLRGEVTDSYYKPGNRCVCAGMSSQQ